MIAVNVILILALIEMLRRSLYKTYLRHREEKREGAQRLTFLQWLFAEYQRWMNSD